MAAENKSTQRGAVSSGGGEAPKRKARQNPKAVSVEPTVEAVSPSKLGTSEISPPSKPDIVQMAPPTADATRIQPPIASSGQVLGLAKKPVAISSVPIVRTAPSSVAPANSEPEYLKDLARERMVWGVIVAVSWAVTFVALLRLGII
ncbi:MAG: hypothetical protein ACLP9K_06585 [Nitrososphaerales archaeon]|jgi:hypothetical protein